MKILQVNTVINTGSTGRIAEEIGQTFIENGHESAVACKRTGPSGSDSEVIQMGNRAEEYFHGLRSRLFDRHGFGSARATRKLIEQMKRMEPDVIGLHNLHGYYLNVEVLFNYLKKVQKPVVWTFHDCWPFTGHCAYYESVNCTKWKTECQNCPLTHAYPASWGIDNSLKNYHQKKELFNGLKLLTIVTPSRWLKEEVDQSFLSGYRTEVIHNGIDLNQFRPVDDGAVLSRYGIEGKQVILGVASIWNRRKGLKYFLDLARKLSKEYKIVLVGLSKEQISQLPDNITGIERTENIEELAALYSAADVFLNPTLTDNFPTTNLEALACGTPVVTFDTGGSPEALDEETGIVVDKKNAEHLYEAVSVIFKDNDRFTRELCRERAVQNFNKRERYNDYLALYESMLSKN